MVKDEFIPVEELPGKPKSSVWSERFERILKGEVLVLLPKDARDVHILRTVAYQNASRKGIKVHTRFAAKEGDIFKLYIWQA